MSVEKKLVAMIWVASCVVFCAAQGQTSSRPSRPDLTGTWVRSSFKSSRGNLESYPVTLTISHNEPELKIARKSVFKGKEKITEQVFYTDGRGEKNEPQFRSALLIGSTPTSGIEQKGSSSRNAEAGKSKTKWEGKKLVSRYSTNMAVMGLRVDMDMTQKRELSSDGKKLSIVTSFTPGGSTIIEVFDRVP